MYASSCLALFAMIVSAMEPSIKKVKTRISSSTIYGVSDKDVYSFLGVTYATADRWEASKMLKPSGNIDATRFGPCCAQRAPQTSEFQSTFNAPRAKASESNQLNLNIYVPSKVEGPLPVMVYLHQGDFSSGSNSELGNDPTSFVAASKTIVVVPNYRVGPLGWAAHPSIDGFNFGLGDVIQSLKWVRRYIKYLGGDSNNITLMGHSAGGIMALSLLTKMTQPEFSQGPPLFHRIILASANEWMMPARSYKVACANTVAYARSIVPNNSRMTDEQVIQKMRNMPELPVSPKFARIFGPIEEEFDSIVKVPILMTSIEDDGTRFVPPTAKAIRYTHYPMFLGQLLTCDAKMVSSLYPCTSGVAAPVIGRLITDLLFRAPMLKLHSRLHSYGLSVKSKILPGATYSAAPYFGELAGSTRGDEVLPGTAGLGAFHYTDVLLLFSPRVRGRPKFTIPEDGSKAIRNLYTAFIRDGTVLDGNEARTNERIDFWASFDHVPVNLVAAGLRL